MSAPVHPTHPAGTSSFQPHSKPTSQTSLVEAAMLCRIKIYMYRKLSPVLWRRRTSILVWSLSPQGTGSSPRIWRHCPVDICSSQCEGYQTFLSIISNLFVWACHGSAHNKGKWDSDFLRKHYFTPPNVFLQQQRAGFISVKIFATKWTKFIYSLAANMHYPQVPC